MQEADNIPNDFDNLERYAPSLFKIKKENPFSVPANYFDTLPEMVMAAKAVENINIATLVNNNVPEGYFDSLPSFIQSQAILSDIKKENPFVVPANYFDYLPARIQEKVHAKKTSWIDSILEKLFSPRLAYALSITILLTAAGIYYFNQNEKIIENNVALSELNKTELIETANDIIPDENFIIDELTAEGIDPSESENKTNSDEIENYLIENNVDINTLIKEM